MKVQDTDSIDRYIKHKMDATEQRAFELTLHTDEALQAEVVFRQALHKTLQWKRQVKTAHQQMH